MNSDATTSRFLTWLDNPNIVLTVYIELWELFHQFLQYFMDIRDDIVIIDFVFVEFVNGLHPLLLSQLVFHGYHLFFRALQDLPLCIRYKLLATAHTKQFYFLIQTQ